jgi:hypothetical protein
MPIRVIDIETTGLDPALPPDTIVWLNGKREVIAVTMPEEKGKEG